LCTKCISWYILTFLIFSSFLGVARNVGAAARPRKDESLAVTFPKRADFQEVWAERRVAIAGGEGDDWRQLEQMIELQRDGAVKNLWGYTSSLIREGLKTEDPARAIKLGEFSQSMAPDLPYAYFYSSQVTWKRQKSRIYEALRRRFQGLQAYIRNVPLATCQMINILYVAGVGLLFAVFAFCLLVFLKRLPMAIHVLKGELKGGVRDMLRGLARIFVFFVPLLLDLNILWSGIYWCLILWRGLSRDEKWLVALCLFLVTYLPAFGGAISTFVAGSEFHAIFDRYEAVYGEREPESLRRLQAWTQEHPRDRDALFAWALTAKREGNFSSATRGYQRVLTVNPSDPDALCNLGNIYFVTGRLEKAIQLYKEAIALNPGDGIFHFNLSKALIQRSLLGLREADRSFELAKEFSPQTIKAHMEIDSPHPNRSVIDADISLDSVYTRLLERLWRQTGPSFLIGDVWLDGLSARFPYVVPLAFLALLILLASGIGSGKAEWWRCSLCGSAGSGTFGTREGRQRICVRCFRILKGKEMDLALREKKLREIREFTRRRSLSEAVISPILPGAGHIWKGYNVRGLFFLWILFMFVVKFYHWQGIIPAPIPSPLPADGWGGWLILVAFVVYYLLVVRGAYKRVGREVLEPPFSLEGIRR